MRLDRIIARSRVVDLASSDLNGALAELLDVSVTRFPDLKRESVLRGLLQRESTMTTYLGLGVALPHVRVKMKRRYIVSVGRSQAGIRYDGLKEAERVHLVVMLIAHEDARDYLQVLAAIARLMKDTEFVRGLLETSDADTFYERLFAGFGGVLARGGDLLRSRTNRMMMREADRVARGADCSAILVFGDTFGGGFKPEKWFARTRAFLVTRNLTELPEGDHIFAGTLQVRSYSNQRLAQLRSAILVGLTRGVVSFNDRLCCIGGVAGSNQFDTLVVVDVEREFQPLLTGPASEFLPDDIKPEVLERVIAVATELAVEGREGRPVGCLFVVGDTSTVEKYAKPLVLNPFYGYKEEDRNILNPFMDETVKEFSSIDGAFVIRGDGVVQSAGTLIQAADFDHVLPSGLGSRHAAAAAISVASQCISIVVSSSTGQVTLFRRGVMLPLTEKRMN